MSYFRRPSLQPALRALWAVVTLGWLAALAVGALLLSDAGSCELVSGSSIYGDAEWSLARLGTVCTYKLQDPDVTLVVAPSLRWVVTVLLLLWGLSLLGGRKAMSTASAGVLLD